MSTRREFLGQTGATLASVAAAAPAAAAERSFAVTPFTAVQVAIPAQVEIAAGREPQVRVRAEARVLERLSVRVAGGLLKLESPKGFETREPVVVLVDLREIRRLQLDASADVRLSGALRGPLEVIGNGAGTITVAGASLTELNARLAGSVTLKLDGKAQRTRFEIDGASEVDARALESRDAAVRISGSGEASLHAAETLSAVIDGAGTVRYRGNPRVTQDVRGAGEVVRE